MNTLAIFGLSVLMSLVSSGLIAQLVVWPGLRNADRDSALVPLVAPHMLLYRAELLVPGVVSSSLPDAFAIPAAYGDFGAGLLAIIATVALLKRAAWALGAVWLFNIWGAADLLFALYQGPRVGIGPEASSSRRRSCRRCSSRIFSSSACSFDQGKWLLADE